MRKLIIFIITAMMTFSFTACKDNTMNKITGADYPITVWGVEIESCPQHIICLSPAVTDIITALGSDAQLIGVSDNCDNDRGLDTFGSSALPEIDKIIKSNAEIIIADKNLSDDAKNKITESGKSVMIYPAVEKYADIEKLYESVASIFSGYSTGSANAKNTFERISERIDTVKSKTKDEKAVNAIILLSDAVAAPKDTLYDEMLTIAGGKNIAGNSYSIDYAEIVKKNPEHIFCPADMVEDIKNDKVLSKIDAVKKGNITAFSPLYFERYGENFALGVEIMASALHPDSVKSPIR
ncbi:MAG: ABC transporter substrate-binding protein [Clostridia bacterium]|nr:ABC transporter substrate-binding protein [Clostridia bacterium]